MEFMERVKEHYWPTADERERVELAVVKLKELVETELEKRNLSGKVMLVGSLAKGTYLKNPDIDLFILFSPSVEEKIMERETLEIGRTILDDFETAYAEHPYAKGTYSGFDVDLVPAYEVESGSQLMTAVDRTPFHTRYVMENAGEEKKEEIMLLKAFCKGIGGYSAEARVRGFSGYLLELLVIRCGSFLQTLDAASDWKRGERVEMVPSGKEFSDPLTVIDPTDPGRNVASALSDENFYRFIAASRIFLESPKKEFFIPKKRSEPNVKKIEELIANRGADIVLLEFPLPKMVDDVLFPQLQKMERVLENHMKNNGFHVMNIDFYVGNNVLFIIEVQSKTIPSAYKHFGPPANHPNAEDFLDKWVENPKCISGPYIEGSKWAVDALREENDLVRLLEKDCRKLSSGKDLKEFLQSAEISIKVFGPDKDDFVNDSLWQFLNRKPDWL